MWLFLVALAMSITCCAASAGSILMGNSDNLQRLSPLQLKGKYGEPLYLGYRTTKVVVGLGIYIKDQGYVLLPASDQALYYPLDAKQIAEMQADGSLPLNLPSRSLPLVEYLYGYSLWIAIAVVATYIRFDELRKKRRAEKGTARDA